MLLFPSAKLSRFFIGLLYTSTALIAAQVITSGAFAAPTWRQVSSLPRPFSGGQAVARGNFLYYFGAEDDFQTIYRAEVAPNGDFVMNAAGVIWSSAGDLPLNAVQGGHIASAVVSDYLYTYTRHRGNMLFRGTFQVDGSISDWKVYQANIDLEERPNAVIIKQGLYVMAADGIRMTALSESGEATVSASNQVAFQAVSSLPLPTDKAAALARGNRLYVLGGNTGDIGMKVTRSDIYSATINADHTLSAWSVIGQLPGPRAEFAACMFGEKLATFGGNTLSYDPATTPMYTFTRQATASSISLTEDDLLPASPNWTTLPALPNPRSDFATVVSKAHGGRFIFALGGVEGASPSAEVASVVVYGLLPSGQPCSGPEDCANNRCNAAKVCEGAPPVDKPKPDKPNDPNNNDPGTQPATDDGSTDSDSGDGGCHVSNHSDFSWLALLLVAVLVIARRCNMRRC